MLIHFFDRFLSLFTRKDAKTIREERDRKEIPFSIKVFHNCRYTGKRYAIGHALCSHRIHLKKYHNNDPHELLRLCVRVYRGQEVTFLASNPAMFREMTWMDFAEMPTKTFLHLFQEVNR